MHLTYRRCLSQQYASHSNMHLTTTCTVPTTAGIAPTCIAPTADVSHNNMHLPTTCIAPTTTCIAPTTTCIAPTAKCVAPTRATRKCISPTTTCIAPTTTRHSHVTSNNMHLLNTCLRCFQISTKRERLCGLYGSAAGGKIKTEQSCCAAAACRQHSQRHVMS